MSKLAFTGDALWGPCPDGGSLSFIDGEPIRSGGLQAAVYISLFGGNELDDGSANSKLQFWGNHIGNDEPIRSRTGTLLMTLPMTSSSLRRIDESVLTDLDWMKTIGLATGISSFAQMQAQRYLFLEVTVQSLNRSDTFKFRGNWESGPFEPEIVC